MPAIVKHSFKPQYLWTVWSVDIMWTRYKHSAIYVIMDIGTYTSLCQSCDHDRNGIQPV